MEEKSDSIKEDTPEILRKFDEITNRVKYQDYIMPYGKHQGRFLCEILVRDPDYFYWAAQHVKGDLQKAFEWHIRITADELNCPISYIRSVLAELESKGEI